MYKLKKKCALVDTSVHSFFVIYSAISYIMSEIVLYISAIIGNIA